MVLIILKLVIASKLLKFKGKVAKSNFTTFFSFIVNMSEKIIITAEMTVSYT